MSDTPQPATPGVRLPFDRSEYDARIAKTRRAMEKAGIDLLIVTDPTNMAWLTGYDGWSFYVLNACCSRPMANPSGMAADRMRTARCVRCS